VQVAIDDFGTGYSGLSYLMRYRFDVLKIDRSFVQGLPDDPRNTAIVQAIVAMARALNYRVVAEGVETFAQADSLRGYGCNEVQGFLYSRPVPAAEFGSLLRRGAIDVVDYSVMPRSA
jgi:EAL domain-containing protein (putative c-di-GMP-specific phosphodiesterase class I)